MVTYEETTHGWFPLHGNLAHSAHPLNPIKEIKSADRERKHSKYNCKIPDQLLDLLSTEDMKDVKMTVEQMHYWLQTKAQKMGYTVDWNYQDVYNAFALTAVEKAYDATGMWEKLEALRDEKGLYCAMANDKSTGRLDQVFFEMVMRMAMHLPEHPAPRLCLTEPHASLMPLGAGAGGSARRVDAQRRWCCAL